MKRELTPAQDAVFTAIRSLREAAGISPTLREIAEVAGLKSPSSVAFHLDNLESRGFIRRDSNIPRSIRIIKERERSQWT